MTSTHKRRGQVLGMPAAMLVTVTVLAAGLGSGVRGVGAQADDGAERHPAHIHAGTCERLGDVVVPLADVGYWMTEGGTPAAGAPVGPASAVPVETSVTTAGMPLGAIIEGGHAINIHLSAEQIGEYIACGDIGGQMVGETLVIGLQELNDSGHAGVAVLEGADTSTTVTVYLVETTAPEGGSAGGTEATPVATEEAAAAEAVAVEIKDFAYDPDPVGVPVGGTITWTNQDAAPHTATANEREVLQSGRLDQGQTYSETFEEAGTFEYFCEFHANMQGTVVVR